jgi:hypothetical protein
MWIRDWLLIENCPTGDAVETEIARATALQGEAVAGRGEPSVPARHRLCVATASLDFQLTVVDQIRRSAPASAAATLALDKDRRISL